VVLKSSYVNKSRSGGVAMVKKPDIERDRIVAGRVILDLPEEEGLQGVEGVLIKSSTGGFTYTNPEGTFAIPVGREDGSFYYALCALKQGFQVWVDWGIFDPEEPTDDLVIRLQVGPEGTMWKLLSLVRLPHSSAAGRVTDCNTGQYLYPSFFRIDGGTWKPTLPDGSFCPYATEGNHTICAKAANHQNRCTSVPFPSAGTYPIPDKDICLNPKVLTLAD
jgi:hypothetical protein